MTQPRVVAYFLGTNNDWGGASRALLNFVRKVDRNSFSPLVVIPKPGPIRRILEAQKIGCEVWPIHERSHNLLAYLLNIVRIMFFLRKHDVALLHINYSAIGWKPAEIIAARILRIPVINHLHAVFADTSSYIRYSAAIIGVSRYVCSNSDCQGIACSVVHNIADFERFGSGTPKRKELGLREDSIVVGFFGQVRRIKGIALFLELPKRMADERVEFLIAGQLRGEDSFAPDVFSKMILADSRIKYLGYREDIQDLYASCDIVVVPSQWEEPCAMVLFEASAAGKAIVATSTGGTPEIVIDGDTGFLVQKDDLDALCDRVARLIYDEKLRESIRRRARERVSSEFVKKPVRQLEDLYRKVLRS